MSRESGYLPVLKEKLPLGEAAFEKWNGLRFYFAPSKGAFFVPAIQGGKK